MNGNEIRSVNRLSRRLAERIDRTFPGDGRLAGDLSLLRRLHRDHAEQVDRHCRALIETALANLVDRVDVNRASFTVAPFHGKEALDAVKPPNGNGAELHQ